MASKVRELSNSISEFHLIFSEAHVLTSSNMPLITFITAFKVLPDRLPIFCLISFILYFNLVPSPYFFNIILLFANTKCMMNCVILDSLFFKMSFGYFYLMYKKTHKYYIFMSLKLPRTPAAAHVTWLETLSCCGKPGLHLPWTEDCSDLPRMLSKGLICLVGLYGMTCTVLYILRFSFQFQKSQKLHTI